MNHHNIINHQDLHIYFAGAAVVNWLVNSIANQDAFLHGVASIATATAACVSVYFAIRNRKK
jgi:hypothetical protein